MGSGMWDNHDNQHCLKRARRDAMDPRLTVDQRARRAKHVQEWKAIVAADGGDPRPPHKWR